MNCLEAWMVIKDGSTLIQLDMSNIARIVIDSDIELLHRGKYLLFSISGKRTFSVVKNVDQETLNISYKSTPLNIISYIN